MGEQILRRWQKGDKFSAGHLNEVVDLAAAALPIFADGDVELQRSGNGTSITVSKRPLARLAILAVTSPVASITGMYNARRLIDLPSLFDPANFTADDFVDLLMKDPGADDALMWRPAEYKGAAGTHDLTFPNKQIWIGYLSQKRPSETNPARPLYYGIGATDPFPKPTARYQVFTPIDDTLVPIWTNLRFQS